MPLRAAFSSSTRRVYFGWLIFDVPVHIDDAGRLLRDVDRTLRASASLALRSRARRPRRPASAAPAARAAPRRP